MVGEYPDAWHFCVVAEDRCRAEHFARIRRKRLLEHQQGLALDFNPRAPWNDVFREAARDTTYWGREVRNKASAFLANRGVKRANTDDTGGDGNAQSHKRRRGGRVQRNTDTGGASSADANASGRLAIEDGKTQGNHPRKDKQGRYLTTREGELICFKFGVGKCETVCPRQMKHVCQKCLAPHPTSKCKTVRK